MPFRGLGQRASGSRNGLPTNLLQDVSTDSLRPEARAPAAARRGDRMARLRIAGDDAYAEARSSRPDSAQALASSAPKNRTWAEK